MKTERKPKQGVFAIIPSEDGALPEIPKEAGIHLVKHGKASKIFLASSEDPTVSDAQLFKELRKFLGPNVRILTVYEDVEGNTVFATGQIDVRLTKALKIKELKAWAADNEVEIVSQSKWRPNTVSLSPVATSPDPIDVDGVAKKLRRRSEVEEAEPVAMVEFKREDK